MNTLTIETFYDPPPTSLFFNQQDRIYKPDYTPKRLRIGTTLTIIESKITQREELINLLKSRNISIEEELVFKNLLDKLHSTEIKLITDIVRKLLKENRSFHIEVYETEGDLEDLYFVIHYEDKVSDEYIEKDIFKLNELVRKIDKNKILWFVSFASEIEDV